MNDLDITERNEATNPGRHDNHAGTIGQIRVHRRRRWVGRLFALGGFLLLAGGLVLGAWGPIRSIRM
jgi:hypothetical protein